jgi:hypothetical protein
MYRGQVGEQIERHYSTCRLLHAGWMLRQRAAENEDAERDLSLVRASHEER